MLMNEQAFIAASVDSLLTDTMTPEPWGAMLPADVADSMTSLTSLLSPDTALFLSPIPVQGQVGTPHAYAVWTDDQLTIMLLACVMLTVFLLSAFRLFFFEKAKEFFFSRSTDDYDPLTASAAHYIPLLLVNCLVMGLGWLVLAGHQLPDGMCEVPVILVGVFALTFALFFFLKTILYAFVNTVFFGSKKRIQWLQAFLFLTTLGGLLLLPMVVALFYFGISSKMAVYYGILVLFLNKILTIYKSYNIFFRQNARYLENILYFCALEITPLLALCGTWMIVVNALKINF